MRFPRARAPFPRAISTRVLFTGVRITISGDAGPGPGPGPGYSFFLVFNPCAGFIILFHSFHSLYLFLHSPILHVSTFDGPPGFMFPFTRICRSYHLYHFNLFVSRDSGSGMNTKKFLFILHFLYVLAMGEGARCPVKI